MHCGLIVLFLSRSDDPFLLIEKGNYAHVENWPGVSAKMKDGLQVILCKIVHFDPPSVIISNG